MGYSLKKAFLNFSKSHNLIQSGQKILVAVSGGIDSMVLLSLLINWRKYFDISLSVIHVNHQLRGEESDLDEQLVADICRQKEIPVFVENVSVYEFAKQHKYSLEEAGHILRRRVFNKILKDKNFDSVATAHNLNELNFAKTVPIWIYGLSGIKFAIN
jgi:tRNA(Ile)-lysidine synthase